MSHDTDYVEVTFQLANAADEKLLRQISEYNERLVYEDRLPQPTKRWVALMT